MPARKLSASASAQIKLRLPREQQVELKALAADQHISVTQVLQLLVGRELGDASLQLGTRRDESVIRDAAILIAIEQVLKLQEATIPGGITRSRQLLDAAVDAAIARLETVEEILARQDRR